MRRGMFGMLIDRSLTLSKITIVTDDLHCHESANISVSHDGSVSDEICFWIL